MESRCVVCGKVFTHIKSGAKYCCSVCKNHSRYGMRRTEQIQNAAGIQKTIIELYNSEYSVKEIAKIVGRSITYVYKTWKDNGLNKRPTKKQTEIIELRKQGKCCVEICEKIGISKQDVYSNVKKLGLPFTQEEVQKSIDLGKAKSRLAVCGTIEERRNKHNTAFKEKHQEWDLVDGWLYGNGCVTVRHNVCDQITQKSAVRARAKWKLICPYCEEEKRKQKERERQEEKALAFKNLKAEQIEFLFKTCAYCGAGFIAKRGSIYCSDDCRKKGINRSHDRRIRKIEYREKGISLHKLYARDEGKCWICGEQCDYDNYSTDEKGNFIVGPLYPSIDHVYPISKGGSHTWDNVKLAHHYCNTIKSDKVVC